MRVFVLFTACSWLLKSTLDTCNLLLHHFPLICNRNENMQQTLTEWTKVDKQVSTTASHSNTTETHQDKRKRRQSPWRSQHPSAGYYSVRDTQFYLLDKWKLMAVSVLVELNAKNLLISASLGQLTRPINWLEYCRYFGINIQVGVNLNCKSS